MDLIGLPLVEPTKRIVVGAEVLRQRALTSDGAVEHPTECDTIERARLDAEPDDPARVLIHDHQDPVPGELVRFSASHCYSEAKQQFANHTHKNAKTYFPH